MPTIYNNEAKSYSFSVIDEQHAIFKTRQLIQKLDASNHDVHIDYFALSFGRFLDGEIVVCLAGLIALANCDGFRYDMPFEDMVEIVECCRLSYVTKRLLPSLPVHLFDYMFDDYCVESLDCADEALDVLFDAITDYNSSYDDYDIKADWKALTY